MGTSSSKASYAEPLAAITSNQPLPFDDASWEALTTLGAPATPPPPAEASTVEEALQAHAQAAHPQRAALLRAMRRYGERFVANNVSSQNLQRLLLRACLRLHECAEGLRRAGAADAEREAARATAAACASTLLVARQFLLCFIETLKQDVLAVHLSGWPDDLDPTLFALPAVGRGVPRALMRALVTFVVSVRVNDDSYVVYHEALTMLVVLFSTPMFVPLHEPSLFLDMLLDEADYFGAASVVSTLLHNVVARVRCVEREQPPGNEGAAAFGLFSRLVLFGSTYFLLLPIRAIDWLLDSGTPEGVPHIANLSALLLLVMGNCRRDNGFTQAFTQFHDAQSPLPATQLSTYAFTANFASLFDTFCARLNHDPHICLFYFAMHRNPFVRDYVASRTDQDALVVPLLRHLYTITSKESVNAQQVYMVLVILLMLSQQEEFGATCQRLLVPEVEWYKEQTLLDISLADLIAVVLVRTVMQNLSRLQDGYLHTNCLAIVANLSPSFSQLHAHTSQRLFALMAFLRKRIAHMEAKLAAQHAGVLNSSRDNATFIVLDASTAALPSAAEGNDLQALLGLYEQLMSILFEVLHAVVSHSLTHNTAFVYALLIARDDLLVLSESERWAPLAAPLVRLVQHFDPLLNREGPPRTTDDVVATIERGLISVPIAPHARGGDLKFTYTEQSNAEEFFTPYIYSLVFVHSTAAFTPSRIQLFWVPEESTGGGGGGDDAADLGDDPLGLVVDA